MHNQEKINFYYLKYLREASIKRIRTKIILFLTGSNSKVFRIILNLFNYLRWPKRNWKDRQAWKRNLDQFHQISKKENFIAFTIYGLKSDNSDIEFYHFLSITSFVQSNPTIPLYIFYAYNNDGILWNKLSKYATLVQISNFGFYRGARFIHYAHKSDILRLLILKVVGGFYFDIDTISVFKIDQITHSSRAVLGLERNPESQEISGICNAIMWSPRNNIFIDTWIKEYKSFFSRGKDAFWGEHSIRLPLKILEKQKFRSHAIVLPPEKLFAIDWLHLNETIFSSCKQGNWDPLAGSPVIHLWETLTHEYLSIISPEYIENSDSWYAKIAKKGLTDGGIFLLPDKSCK